MTEIECDLLVIGSGAAGMSAAVTAAIKGLDVIVAEAAETLGGTTAWSGGWMWLPRNPLAKAAGIDEDIALPRAYLQSVLGEGFDPERIDSFLTNAPEMVAFLTAHGMEWEAGNAICDIYADRPGVGTGGRSLIAAPLDGRALGNKIKVLRKTKWETSFLGMPIQAGADLAAFLTATKSRASFLHVTRRVLRHAWDIMVHGRSMQLCNGVALTARLFAIGEQFGVTWRRGCYVRCLKEENGYVVGAECEEGGTTAYYRARKGVVLATGGFSRSTDLVRRHFPCPDDHASLPPSHAGRGLAFHTIEKLRPKCITNLPANGAWCPVSIVPKRKHSPFTNPNWEDCGTSNDGRPFGLFPHIVERGKPGLIAVRRDGRRFVNEADGYHDFVNALHDATPPDESAECWLLCDHAFLRRWGLGMVKPFPVPYRHWIRRGYLLKGRSIADLAAKCGIDADALSATITRTNADALRGEDSAFHRGWSPYNRNQGDKSLSGNPNVAAIVKPPFYAVRVIPGSFSSFAGLATDADARVLNEDGNPIPGLYAAGADAASVMAGHYPAGGINLGPAMVFGYRAACHASALV